MNEKKFDRWIGILSISVIALVAIVFVSITSNVHLAKGTYGAYICPNGYGSPTSGGMCCPSGYNYSGGVCCPSGYNYSGGECKVNRTYSTEDACVNAWPNETCRKTTGSNGTRIWIGTFYSTAINATPASTSESDSEISGNSSTPSASSGSSSTTVSCPSGYESNGNPTKTTDCYVKCKKDEFVPYPTATCQACPDGKTSNGGTVHYGSASSCTASSKDDPGTTTPPNPGNSDGSGNSGWPSGYSCSGYCGGTITCNYDTTGYKCNSNGNDYNYVCFKEGNMYKCDPALCTGMCGGTLTCNYDTSGYKCDYGGTTYYYHSCDKKGNTYTCSPSTNPSSNGSSTNPSGNPQTGTTAIIFVWIIGVVSLVYSVWYFTRKNQNI